MIFSVVYLLTTMSTGTLLMPAVIVLFIVADAAIIEAGLSYVQ